MHFVAVKKACFSEYSLGKFRKKKLDKNLIIKTSNEFGGNKSW